MNLELRNQWLKQQNELFGNSVYLEQLNDEINKPLNLDEFYQQINNCQNCS